MKLTSFEVGADRPFFLIAGPCVIESESLVIDVAGRLKEMTAALKIPFIFKASFDKANRSSRSSFRGPGLQEALALTRDRQHEPGEQKRQEHAERDAHYDCTARRRGQVGPEHFEERGRGGHQTQQEHRRRQLRRRLVPKCNVPERPCQSQHCPDRPW